MIPISINDYDPSMGKLITLKNSKDYDNLLLNYKTLLNKDDKYFIMCNHGKKSKQAARILKFYGYNVTYVINN